MAQIQQGKKLKKAETNDRSAPIVAGASKPAGGGRGGPSVPAPGARGGPQLGGLFADGMPKLKPAGQTPPGPLYYICIFLTFAHVHA